MLQMLAGQAQSDRNALVDIGCGTGAMAQLLLEKGFQVIGLDRLADGLLSRKQSMPELQLLQADVSTLPLADDLFQTAIALDVMEHVAEAPFLAEIRRILKPQGLALLTVPAIPALWSYRDEAAGHLRRYTRRSLRQVLQKAGFEVVKMRYYQFFLFPIVYLSRLMGRKKKIMRDREESINFVLNRILAGLNLFEVYLGKYIPWPWGSSLAVLCRVSA